MRFYIFLGRLLSPCFMWGVNIYGRIVKTPRVRVMLWNEQGEVLLVRGWVGSQRWEFPGGAVKEGEPFQSAARRELFEETGIDKKAEELSYVTTLYGRYEAPIYQKVINSQELPARLHNPFEITAVRWCNPKNLPNDTSQLVRLALRFVSKMQ